ncbi:Trace amine-associated receptor 4 [Trichoplax sp. H2]|nr:Trace amine-associated receptor 4 [Trichoplax sp. H2]|eukprot:RDD42358.1 Trace amine-associated receptor 4 [Trichoplax sp. H2]
MDSINSTQSSLPYYSSTNYLAIVILILLAIACILGNLLSIIVIYRNKNMHDPSGLLMANLATADLCIGLIFMTTTVVYTWKKSYMFNELSCAMRAYLITVITTVSQFTAAYIAIDRCIYVCKPLHYPMWITKWKMGSLIIFTWILASLFGSIPLMQLERYGLGRYTYVSYMYSCWLDIKKFQQNGSILLLLFNTFIGLLLIVSICYIIILYKAKKVHTTIQPFRRQFNIRQQLPTRMVKLSWINKPTKTSVILVGVYLICAAPTAIFGITMTLNFEYYNVSDACYRVLLYWCMYANALANPFIFGFSHRDFRQTYRSLCCKNPMRYIMQFLPVKKQPPSGSLSFTIVRSSDSNHHSISHYPASRSTRVNAAGGKNVFLDF